MKPILVSLLVFALVSVPVKCIAQRANDPGAATTINDEIRSKKIEVVKQQASAGNSGAQLQLALGYLVGGCCLRTTNSPRMVSPSGPAEE